MPSRVEHALLPGVDRAAFAAALGHRLRSAGVPVTLTALASFSEALAVAPPVDRSDLYWLARLTLVHQPHHLPDFDRVFAAVFDAVTGLDPHARRHDPAHDSAHGPADRSVSGRGVAVREDGGGLPWHTRGPVVAESMDDDATGSVLPELLPSAVERFSDVPFDELDADQLTLLADWFEQTLHRWPTRRSRRRRVHPAGRRVALRETVAASRRTGWETIRLSRSRPVLRPRPLLVLVDVSGSMQSYATAYLHLMRALARAGRAETFVCATSLTRVTPALAHSSARVAVARAAEQAPDRFGGTHLAAALRTLLRSRHGNAMRGGVVVVASDGWDSDDPAELAATMARVRRRAHRVVWLNPRAAAPGFAPLVGSMASALPFCDDFLPAHTVQAMRDVLDALGDAVRR
jgi:hypothetical protein